MPETEPLLNAIQEDSLLKQTLENPFYLNTAQLLFASRKNWSDFDFVAADVEGRRRELVQKFVEYALEHKNLDYQNSRDYPAKKAKKWLVFLAEKMEELSKEKKGKIIDLEISSIQPNWLVDNRLYGLFYYFFISFCLFFTVLICGMFATAFSDFSAFARIFQPDSILYFFQALFEILLRVLLGSIFLSIVFFLCASVFDLIWGLALLLFNVVVSHFGLSKQKKSVEKRIDVRLINKKFNYPKIERKYKKRWSWKKYISNWSVIIRPRIILFIKFFIVLFVCTLYTDISSSKIKVIFPDLFWTILLELLGFFIIAVLLGFAISINDAYKKEVDLGLKSPYGSMSDNMIFQHPSIRLALSFESSLPLRLVHFLNEMSRRHLLEFDGNLDTETGGGSWRWRHRIIQEYFLTMNE
jgi:hypothetical protein